LPTVQRLSINQLRNIQSADLLFCPQVNLLIGPNGSGKTTILEALSILAHGRSFRSHLSTPLVSFGSKQVTLFCDCQEGQVTTPIGIVKQLGKGTDIRIDSSAAQSSSQLARVLPFLVVDGSSFSLLDGSSKYRRSVLDWLLFHVEHDFLPYAKDYRLALKQRNALLRRGIFSGYEVKAWSPRLAELGEQLNTYRSRVFDLVKQALGALCSDFDIDIEMEYNRGWKSDAMLAYMILECSEADKKAQTTTAGPHRADIQFITQEGQKVSEILSRGQKKKLIVLV
jgi:DNA replication and repair protein RecF